MRYAGPPLELPADALLLVCGLPGAGKTTWLRAVVPRADPGLRVIDADDRRAELGGGWRCWTPVLHTEHVMRALKALRRPGAVLVHTRGTQPVVRRALLRAARGRARWALVLHVSPGQAQEGQRRRGRRLGGREMRRQERAWARFAAAGPAGLRAEGFDEVLWLEREQAPSAFTLSR